MAIAKKDIFIAPSVDKKMLSELDSVVIESGIYTCSEEVSIGGITSNKWTVICLSNETKEGLHCYSQLWVSIEDGKLPRLFIRSSAKGTESYSEFSSFINCPTDKVVDLYIGGEEPQAEEGITKIFIDLQ